VIIMAVLAWLKARLESDHPSLNFVKTTLCSFAFVCWRDPVCKMEGMVHFLSTAILGIIMTSFCSSQESSKSITLAVARPAGDLCASRS